MKKFYFFTYLLLFALILGNQASAIEVGTDVKIGTNLNSSQFPQVVSCTNGNNFLVVWSGDQDGKDRIYYNFQDVASVSGVPFTTGTLLSEIVTGKFNYAERPQVAYDASSNTAAVVWQESHVVQKDSVVMALINTTTKLKTTQIVVASGSWNMSSTVSSNHNGTYLVVWYDATSQNISGRFYGISGSPVGSAVVLGSVPSGYLLPYSIDIDYNSTDAQFLVSWADLSTNLFSRTIKADGTLGTLNNYSTISGVVNPALAYNDLTNEFLLVYDDFAGNISGILTDNTGVKIGSPLTFGSIPGIQAEPDVRLNSDNHAYAISWHDPSLTAGIWFQEYSGTLVPTFTTALKIDSQTATSYAPSIAYGGSEYWISWFGQSPALKDEIYLQRYESDFTQEVKAKCQDVSVSLNASGNYTLSAAEINNGSSASSGIATMVLSKTAFTCDDIATNPNEVTLTVTDNDGNIESCTATVTVVDDVDPVAKAKAYTAELDATGNATITSVNVDDGSSDACGIQSLVLSKTDFTCDDIATNPNVVTLTVTDNYGNASTANANITVLDKLPPVIVGKDFSADLGANGSFSLTLAYVLQNAFTSRTDNCGLQNIVGVTGANYTCNNIGDNTLTIYSYDLSGNQTPVTVTLTINDPLNSCNQPPVAVCKSIVVNADANCSATITAADINNGSSDPDNDPLSYSIDNPGPFGVGVHSVELTVSDGSLTSKCTATVTVVDNTPPSITCPANKTSASDAGLCTKTFTAAQIGSPSASDNCSYSISWSRSDTAPILTDPFQFGVTTITWTATDPAGLTASCSQTITIDKITTITTVTVTPNSQQYSDLVEFKATISPWNCAVGGNAGGDVTFYVGTQAMGAPVAIGSDGIATMLYPLVEIPSQPSNGQMAPGNHVVLADFNNTDPAFDVQDKTTLLTIIPENALVEYVGGEFQATQSSTSSIANVVLRAVIKSVADAPGSSGDIRNACVTFEIGGITIGPLTPQLINPADITTGVVVYNWTANIGTADYQSFDLKVKANCYFVGEDQTVITVYKPIGDFISGGGSVKPTFSSGVYASTPGLKANFGFHVKFNKKGTSLQGGMNIIFRRQVGVETQLFQIKTNSMSTLGVNISDPNAKTGVFTSKANLKNLTTGESLGGNLQLQVKITDRGEPGANDDIAITLWDGNLLLFSSNWTGINTAPLLLSGGNLVVQSGFGLKSAEIVTGISQLPNSFEVKMYPNPSKGVVMLDIVGSEIMNSEVVVRSITGSEVFRKEYKASEQIRFDLSKLVSGTYLVTLEIDGKFIVKKLILDKN